MSSLQFSTYKPPAQPAQRPPSPPDPRKRLIMDTPDKQTENVEDMIPFTCIGRTVVYVPRQYADAVAGNDFANDYSYDAQYKGWMSTEVVCCSHHPMSEEDWLACYTYVDPDTRKHVYNGILTNPSNISNKYYIKDFEIEDDDQSMFGDGDSDSS